MAVKMRWGKTVKLKDVGNDQEFVTYKSSAIRIEDHSRFRRVSNVMRVGVYGYKRGITIDDDSCAVARTDGHVCRMYLDKGVVLIEYYNEPDGTGGQIGPPEPKKKRK